MAEVPINLKKQLFFLNKLIKRFLIYIPVTEAWLCGIIRCWNVNGVVKVVPNHRSEVQCSIYCDGNGSTKGMVNINFCVSFLITLKIYTLS